MPNYKMLLQYEGTRYQGWQRQISTDNTIQGKLENLLGKRFGVPIEVQGAGRTDAGVHALGQVANFHLDTPAAPDELMDEINRYLPEDIAVVGLEQASGRFHSRLNAKAKTYLYRVLNNPIPHIFDRRYVYQFPDELDIAAMRQAAADLCGTHDYSAFTSNRRSKKSTVRTVTDIRIEPRGDEIQFTFCGNGFLYHMVRIMTGTLLEVGTHRRKAEEAGILLDSGQREAAGPLAPAKGLTLVEVHYS